MGEAFVDLREEGIKLKLFLLCVDGAEKVG
jgi:hypothetical protein